MLADKIKDFESKYKAPFPDVLSQFEDGKSRSKLSEEFNISEMVLRQFIYSLGLEFPKSKRQISIEEFRYKLALEKSNDVDLVKTLETQVNKLHNENYKLHKSLILQMDNNTLLRRKVRECVREENVIDNIVNSLSKDLPKLNTNISVDKPNVVSLLDEGLCLVLSDEHLGDVVDKEEVPFNEYNYEIAEKRIKKVIIELLTFPYQSDKLTVFQLLDTIKGIIHGGVYDSEGGFTTSILKAVELYTKIYKVLASSYKYIDVYVTLDNHGRKTEKPSTKDRWDNYSVLIMKLVKHTLTTNGITNVNFIFSKNDYIEASINTTNILAFHGDTVRSYNPTTASSVGNVHAIALQMFNKTFKHFISGHRHSSIICDNQYGGKCIQNGTLVGGTPYGVATGFSPNYPSQTIFFVESTGNIEQFKTVSL